MRNVFGDFQKAAVKGGIHMSQNLVLYPDGAGSFCGFDYSSDVHRAMSRQQGIGIYSHVVAARDALHRFIQDGSCKHAIASGLHCSSLWGIQFIAGLVLKPCYNSVSSVYDMKIKNPERVADRKPVVCGLHSTNVFRAAATAKVAMVILVTMSYDMYFGFRD